MPAPSTATDILPIATLKAELRLPASDTGQDTLLEAAIDDAVSRIEGAAGLPMLPATRVERTPAPRSGERDPVVLPAAWITGVSQVSFHGPSQHRSESPTGTFDHARLRLEQPESHSRSVTIAWPTSSAGWPESLASAPWLWTLTCQVATVPPRLKRAVIVAARDYFDGWIRPCTDASIRRLVRADNGRSTIGGYAWR